MLNPFSLRAATAIGIDHFEQGGLVSRFVHVCVCVHLCLGYVLGFEIGP